MNVEAKGMITVSMDDGREGVYLYAYPILHERNIPATFFVTTNFVGTRNFVNLSQLHELQSAGWEIASHTKSHPHLPRVNDSQLEDEIKNSKDWFVKNGFVVQTFAYPYGETDSRVTDQVKKYYVVARTVTGTPVTYSPADVSNISTNIAGVYVGNSSIPTIKKWINNSIKNDRWLIIYLHNVNSTGYISVDAVNPLGYPLGGGQNFTELADFIKSKVDDGSLEATTFINGWYKYKENSHLTSYPNVSQNHNRTTIKTTTVKTIGNKSFVAKATGNSSESNLNYTDNPNIRANVSFWETNAGILSVLAIIALIVVVIIILRIIKIS